jgi:hypothetical protein
MRNAPAAMARRMRFHSCEAKRAAKQYKTSVQRDGQHGIASQTANTLHTGLVSMAMKLQHTMSWLKDRLRPGESGARTIEPLQRTVVMDGCSGRLVVATQG